MVVGLEDQVFMPASSTYDHFSEKQRKAQCLHYCKVKLLMILLILSDVLAQYEAGAE